MRRTRCATSTPRDRGSVVVELVVLAPALVALMLFVVFVGRAGGAVGQVRHAADVGARAASLVGRSRMGAAAAAAVGDDLSTNGANCSQTSVSVALTTAGQVDAVTVTVACDINAAGTELLGAARTVTASSTEVIDRFRAG